MPSLAPMPTPLVRFVDSSFTDYKRQEDTLRRQDDTLRHSGYQPQYTENMYREEKRQTGLNGQMQVSPRGYVPPLNISENLNFEYND